MKLKFFEYNPEVTSKAEITKEVNRFTAGKRIKFFNVEKYQTIEGCKKIDHIEYTILYDDGSSRAKPAANHPSFYTKEYADIKNGCMDKEIKESISDEELMQKEYSQEELKRRLEIEASDRTKEIKKEKEERKDFDSSKKNYMYYNYKIIDFINKKYIAFKIDSNERHKIISNYERLKEKCIIGYEADCIDEVFEYLYKLIKTEKIGMQDLYYYGSHIKEFDVFDQNIISYKGVFKENGNEGHEYAYKIALENLERDFNNGTVSRNEKEMIMASIIAKEKTERRKDVNRRGHFKYDSYSLIPRFGEWQKDIFHYVADEYCNLKFDRLELNKFVNCFYNFLVLFRKNVSCSTLDIIVKYIYGDIVNNELDITKASINRLIKKYGQKMLDLDERFSNLKQVYNEEDYYNEISKLEEDYKKRNINKKAFEKAVTDLKSKEAIERRYMDSYTPIEYKKDSENVKLHDVYLILKERYYNCDCKKADFLNAYDIVTNHISKITRNNAEDGKIACQEIYAFLISNNTNCCDITDDFLYKIRKVERKAEDDDEWASASENYDFR